MTSRSQPYKDQGVAKQAEGTASAKFLIRNEPDKSENQKLVTQAWYAK